MAFRDTPWPEGTPCWVEVLVDDPVRLSAFYQGLFGWTFVDHGADYQHYLTGRLEGRGVADIGPRSPGDRAGESPEWLACFAVENADVAAVRITGCGGELEIAPTGVGTHGRFAVATDPAGARFAIWQTGAYLGAEVVGVPGSVIWYQCRSTDPDAAAAFYAKAFGLTPGPDTGASFPDGVTLGLGGRPVAGISGPDTGPPRRSHWEVTFGVADLGSAMEAVTALGGTLRGDTVRTARRSSVLVADPQGTPFRLMATGGDPD